MNEPIRHIAGPYEDGVQQCVRCLKILIDNRKTRLTFRGGSQDALRDGFREGVPLCFDYENAKCWYEYTYDSTDLVQAVNCEPMEDGL